MNYTWELSSDGFYFTPVLSGIGASNYTFFYNPYTFNATVLRVTATDGAERTVINFIYLNLSNSQMIAVHGNNGQRAAQLSRLEPTIFPNPANGDDIFIDFELDENTKELSFELVNNAGKVVSYILKHDVGEGRYTEKIDVKNIPTDFHVLRTTLDGNPNFQKIVISK